MKIINLRTERVVAPVGVDFKQQVFSVIYPPFKKKVAVAIQSGFCSL